VEEVAHTIVALAMGEGGQMEKGSWCASMHAHNLKGRGGQKQGGLGREQRNPFWVWGGGGVRGGGLGGESARRREEKKVVLCSLKSGKVGWGGHDARWKGEADGSVFDGDDRNQAGKWGRGDRDGERRRDRNRVQ